MVDLEGTFGGLLHDLKLVSRLVALDLQERTHVERTNMAQHVSRVTKAPGGKQQ